MKFTFALSMLAGASALFGTGGGLESILLLEALSDHGDYYYYGGGGHDLLPLMLLGGGLGGTGLDPAGEGGILELMLLTDTLGGHHGRRHHGRRHHSSHHGSHHGSHHSSHHGSHHSSHHGSHHGGAVAAVQIGDQIIEVTEHELQQLMHHTQAGHGGAAHVAHGGAYPVHHGGAYPVHHGGAYPVHHGYTPYGHHGSSHYGRSHYGRSHYGRSRGGMDMTTLMLMGGLGGNEGGLGGINPLMFGMMG